MTAPGVTSAHGAIFGGVPVVFSRNLEWRQVLAATDPSRDEADVVIIVGDAPRFPQPEVERIRRQAVLESRRTVREAFGLPTDTILDDLWDRSAA